MQLSKATHKVAHVHDLSTTALLSLLVHSPRSTSALLCVRSASVVGSDLPSNTPLCSHNCACTHSRANARTYTCTRAHTHTTHTHKHTHTGFRVQTRQQPGSGQGQRRGQRRGQETPSGWCWPRLWLKHR
eukprot:1160202-Pelagomonas_calceolata.AAC.5